MAITVKVKLEGIKNPPCWRRIALPNKATFRDLHEAIQSAFGWESYHLWCFHPTEWMGDSWSVEEEDPEARFYESDYKGPKLSPKLRLLDVPLPLKFFYTYDWGDQWVHSITVESYDMAELKALPVLTRKGEAPEEDSAGPEHWMWLREHPEEREAMYR